VLSVAVSPDGRQVLTGGDTSLILWVAQSGKIVRRLTRIIQIGANKEPPIDV
jgi:hypothetical protein